MLYTHTHIYIYIFVIAVAGIVKIELENTVQNVSLKRSDHMYSDFNYSFFPISFRSNYLFISVNQKIIKQWRRAGATVHNSQEIYLMWSFLKDVCPGSKMPSVQFPMKIFLRNLILFKVLEMCKKQNETYQGRNLTSWVENDLKNWGVY